MKVAIAASIVVALTALALVLTARNSGQPHVMDNSIPVAVDAMEDASPGTTDSFCIAYQEYGGYETFYKEFIKGYDRTDVNDELPPASEVYNELASRCG